MPLPLLKELESKLLLLWYTDGATRVEGTRELIWRLLVLLDFTIVIFVNAANYGLACSDKECHYSAAVGK